MCVSVGMDIHPHDTHDQPPHKQTVPLLPPLYVHTYTSLLPLPHEMISHCSSCCGSPVNKEEEGYDQKPQWPKGIKREEAAMMEEGSILAREESSELPNNQLNTHTHRLIYISL